MRCRYGRVRQGCCQGFFLHMACRARRARRHCPRTPTVGRLGREGRLEMLGGACLDGRISSTNLAGPQPSTICTRWRLDRFTVQHIGASSPERWRHSVESRRSLLRSTRFELLRIEFLYGRICCHVRRLRGAENAYSGSGHRRFRHQGRDRRY